MKTVLKHAYLREGDSRPDGIEAWDWVVHVAAEDEGTGLHIWWFGYEDEDLMAYGEFRPHGAEYGCSWRGHHCPQSRMLPPLPEPAPVAEGGWLKRLLAWFR